MSVVCAACGKVSRDREFCDHCNADLQVVEDRLPPPDCPLPGGAVPLDDGQRKTLSRVEAAIALPGPDATRWRVHWVPAADRHIWRPLLDDRRRLDLDVLPGCVTVDEERGQWVICPAAPTPDRPWHDRPPIADPLERLRALLTDVTALARTFEQLHRHNRIWLNFDPAAIEDMGPLPAWGHPDAAELGLRFLRITNLDLRLFRRGECPASLGFNARYVPPEVCAFRSAEIGPATDVYHLAIFAYYWCAGLLPDGFAGAGLEAFDHRLPQLRLFAPDLPEGIIPVLSRGLAIEPRQRPATPTEFATALRKRYEEARRRRDSAGGVRWDAACVSHSGRCKEALGKGNEDHGLLRQFPMVGSPDAGSPDAGSPNAGLQDTASPPGESAEGGSTEALPAGAVLAAVADGISTCDIGSGALASLVATIILENRFDAGSSHVAFGQQVAAACREGSQRVLDWAMEKGYQEQLSLGLDLMGTTLTVAWVEGRELSIGNLGDSRVYLITEQWADQLTVDGDLGSELLARGTPPEQVLRMGVVARALRSCVGGCTVNDGKVEVLPESCVPTLSRWPLVPGDVVVLCTDGLIEEGFFLEPETVASLVRAQRNLSAAELAHRLVEAADALQRTPSPAEPEGFGDNITCVVIKIEGSRE
jgi:serine/threonine protein phosphatase PrpC